MEIYDELCDYRRRAFEFISQAIQCEETGDNESLAQSLYRVSDINKHLLYFRPPLLYISFKLNLTIHLCIVVNTGGHKRTRRRIREIR